MTGAGNYGKTVLLKRQKAGDFQEEYKPTLGVKVSEIQVDGLKLFEKENPIIAGKKIRM